MPADTHLNPSPQALEKIIISPPAQEGKKNVRESDPAPVSAPAEVCADSAGGHPPLPPKEAAAPAAAAAPGEKNAREARSTPLNSTTEVCRHQPPPPQEGREEGHRQRLAPIIVPTEVCADSAGGHPPLREERNARGAKSLSARFCSLVRKTAAATRLRCAPTVPADTHLDAERISGEEERQ